MVRPFIHEWKMVRPSTMKLYSGLFYRKNTLNDYFIVSFKSRTNISFNSDKQKGKSSSYKRRKPSDSELKSLNHSKTYLYNFIRMLEDPYPNAFMKVGKHKIIFKSAKLFKNKLSIEADIE